MSITIEVTELKKELQSLQKGEFKLGYVYADDLVHLTDVFKAIDRLANKKQSENTKDCNGCFGASFGDCEICDERGEAQNENKCNLL